MNPTESPARGTDKQHRDRLRQIDARLNNLRAFFAVVFLAVILSFVFGMFRDDPNLKIASGFGVLVLGWCLTMRYKLVREHDRIARQLSWIGWDRADAATGEIKPAGQQFPSTIPLEAAQHSGRKEEA